MDGVSARLLYLFSPTRAFGGAQNVVLALAMNRHPDENVIAPATTSTRGSAWNAFLTALLGTTTAPSVLDGITDRGDIETLAELYGDPELDMDRFISPPWICERGLASRTRPCSGVVDPSRFDNLRVPD